MKKISEIIVRPFDWSRDLSDVLNLRMTREQEKNNFSSTTDRLLREVRRHPMFGSKLFVLYPHRQSGERVAGFFLIEPLTPPSSTRCVLKGLLVDASFQQCGIGTRLLHKLPALISHEFPGARYLHLAVHKNNRAAIKLCEGGGFIKTGKEIPVGASNRYDTEYALEIKQADHAHA